MWEGLGGQIETSFASGDSMLRDADKKLRLSLEVFERLGGLDGLKKGEKM